MNNPWLSVVAVSRNDDHGGDPLYRTGLFISSLAVQAERYALPVELILVEWNPPKEKPSLADVLDFPVNPYFTARIIVVPPSLHEGFHHGDRQPLFQMIGKNIGIRRAAGEFILATNIDILLDDSLFECIAQKNLDKQCMYRSDRYDINNIPSCGHEAQQVFCRDTTNHARRNHRIVKGGYCPLQEKTPFESKSLLAKKHIFLWGEFTEGAFPSVALKPGASLELLNNNACGDFTLMHRDAWADIRGYGEFEAYSFNIDSIGCIQAYLAGYTEVSFLPPLVCYHIEHAPGSGWTPETSDLLFKRIIKNNIPLVHWPVIEETLIKTMEEAPRLALNDERWGLRDFTLEEIILTESGQNRVSPVYPEKYYKMLSAVNPRYDSGLCFQDHYFSEAEARNKYPPQFDLALRLVQSRVWKLLVLGLPFFRILKKVYRFIKRFLRGKRAENQG